MVHLFADDAIFDPRLGGCIGIALPLCDLLDVDGEPNGYLIAVDVVDAGVGDRVLICDEGTSARQIFGIDTGPIRSVIVGIVDEIA